MEKTKLEKSVSDLPGQVHNLPEIVNQGILDRYNKARSHIKDLKKEIDSTFDPIIKKANDAHKEAIAQKKRFTIPLKDASDFVNKAIADYMAKKELERRAAIREAEEKRRLEQEKLRKEAEDKLREAIEAEGDGNFVDKMDEAVELEDKAKELEETQPLNAPPVPKLDNAHIRTTYDFEITDLDAIPRKYLIPDMILLRRVVKAERDKCDIPGIRIVKKSHVVGR